MILLAPLAVIASILRGYRSSPEDTERVGRTGWVGAIRARNLAWTTFKVGVETLTANSIGASIGTLLDIVAGHDGISVHRQSVRKNKTRFVETHPMYPLA